MLSQKTISSYFSKMQNTICAALENIDGKAKFSTDKWKRKEGGGGITRVIQNGNIFEKGGVNFSAVSGKCPDFILKEHSSKNFHPEQFFATGLSIVMHPKSPMVPIIHMNIRYFNLTPRPHLLRRAGAPTRTSPPLPIEETNWFGGGVDLTPHYINKEDAKFFHQSLKNICDKHDKNFYPEFKKWADDYFFIKHRNETRGIGGIFFDHLTSPLASLQKERGAKTNALMPIEQVFDFVKSVAEVFLPSYLHLVNKNKKLSYGKREKEWQMIRRGRYVEFNLVYDKGTKFGLETGGRTESILMSLPLEAKWVYNFCPAKNSPEEKTLKLLKKGIDWAT